MATYGYARVSGQDQIAGEGFGRQHAAIARKALSMSLPIATFIDEQGVCGAVEGTERPAFTTLLTLCKAGDTIIVEALHRLARELTVQETIIKVLKAHSVRLVSATEDVDTVLDTPERVMIRQILGAVAQLDRSNIVSKLRDARQRIKARTGVCEGRKPYGHHASEREAVARMQALRASGMSYASIAARLNSDGIAPRSARAWSAATVCGIVNRG